MKPSDMADELQWTKDDASEWGDAEPGATAVPKGKLAAMISVRLTAEELEAVQEAAAKSGQTVSRYLRRLVICDLEGGRQRRDYWWPGIQMSSRGSFISRVDTPRVLSDGRNLTTYSA